MATSWIAKGNLTGPQGDDGPQGVGVDTVEVNGSGDLIITLTDTTELNAGHVVGANGNSVNFENSVANAAALPSSPALNSAYYVRDVGHLAVYEGPDAADDIATGYTDVGQIKGDTGSTGTSGTNGVSVTGAAINGSGHLILTLSSGGPIDAGVAKGADGATGADGDDGAPGSQIYTYSVTPPAVGTVRVGDIAIGANGDLLQAV